MQLKDLKKIWKESGFRPEKSLGQNFLIDENIKRKILRDIVYSKDDIVLEIGPGFGIMTFGLAEATKHVYAIEKDSRLCRIMGPFFAEKGNITLINKDILDVDLSEYSPGEKIRVYGNVPYCITTPIIENVIRQRSNVKDLTMVLQDELADRIVAKPGSKIYGSITCFIQYYARASKVMKISKGCFCPAPKVDSCLLRLELLDEPSVRVKDEELLFKVIRGAFSQRRKKLINPLSSDSSFVMDKAEWENVLKSCSIDPSSRAEALSLAEYAKIANLISI